MSALALLSVIESPRHPNFSGLYRRLDISEVKLNSIRKALKHVKTHKPDLVIAEFCYGYSTNYSGVHISNLDVLLATLQKYAPHTRVIVLVDKSERQYLEKLNDLFPLHAVLQFPVQEAQLEAVLKE